MMSFVAGLGTAFVLLVSIVLIARYYKEVQAWAFVALLWSVEFFLIHYLMPQEWRWLSSTIHTAIPALFWINCVLAFSSARMLNAWLVLVAIYTVVGPGIARHLGELGFAGNLIGWQLPQLFEYVLILLGIWEVVRTWSDDLVESRRQMRVFVLGIAGVAILLVVFSIQFDVGGALGLVSLTAIALGIIATMMLLTSKGVRDMGGQSIGLNPLEETETVAAPQNKEVQRLEEVMMNGFYREDKVTILKLAKALDIPEYRTRILINQTLGYKNFNEYINHLRVDEACKRLKENLSEPVLNISLDVGYRSVSSFNRAFKEIKGTSPTEYRNNH